MEAFQTELSAVAHAKGERLRSQVRG
jgi:hypothetical protein